MTVRKKFTDAVATKFYHSKHKTIVLWVIKVEKLQNLAGSNLLPQLDSEILNLRYLAPFELLFLFRVKNKNIKVEQGYKHYHPSRYLTYHRQLRLSVNHL